MNVVWQPQERQRIFLSRPEDEALYGGAAGGGKSDALLMDAVRQVNVPNYKAILMRKTYPQLSELIERSRWLYARAFPKARYNGSEHVWRFPSGAQVKFGSINHPQDRINYQGHQYDFIGFDEATHFTQDEIEFLRSRNRPSGPGTRVYMRYATNPGGIGHVYLKRRFVDPAPPGTTIRETVRALMPNGKEKSWQLTRIFIPSTVWDNQALLKNNPKYVADLASLPEQQRKQLLEGSWDYYQGQVFGEWRNDPGHYLDQTWTHVIQPFPIPAWWKIYRGLDWGYERPFSVAWYAIDGDGRMYRIREYYGTNGQSNQGLRMTPDAVARKIREIENEDPNIKGRSIIGIADPAIMHSQTGPETSVEYLMRKGANIRWLPGNHDRFQGLMQCHYRLAFGDDGKPMFYVFSTCRHFIELVPALVYDTANPEDVDTDMEDHIYDEWRYVCMANPCKARQSSRPPAYSGDDPLELQPQKGTQPMFYRV
ncbi:MAG: terminase family protein [Clostridia bacterium]|nr:terminase family protein [Clostridia bacterium]